MPKHLHEIKNPEKNKKIGQSGWNDLKEEIDV